MIAVMRTHRKNKSGKGLNRVCVRGRERASERESPKPDGPELTLPERESPSSRPSWEWPQRPLGCP